MIEPETVQIVCDQCSASLPTGASSCPTCGAKRGVASSGVALSDVIDNRWVVLGILFLVMAGFGLPILWKSRAFTRRSKSVLTVIVLVYTVLVVWLIVLGVQHIYATISQLWA